MSVVLYDDAAARQFEPFALTRPAGELRAGGEIIRRRWTRVLGMEASGFVGAAHLASFDEFDAPRACHRALAADTWLVNARCAPVLDAVVAVDARVLRVGGRIAAVRLASPVALTALADGRAPLDSFAVAGAAADIEGWWLDQVWDLIRHLNPMLASDVRAWSPSQPEVPAHLTVLGAHPVHVDLGAHVEPLVVIDATAGPVLVRRGATVQSFTRLVGPCIIGEDATVSGGRVAACSIGERVKVNGEISSTIMIGHCNKGHDGFVGHSVIGRWANLGADTVTSNLKNSYGTVQLWTPRGVEETGLQFLGAMIGDHAKTGIGTRLTTGCVLGAGANVFGTTMPPKVVTPFAWGEAPSWDTFAIDKFLEVSQRVMARREVELSPGMRECLRAAHAARWSA
jgi:UDP-N-acetylglucosamine diphosphorylase / glucose-1-phosphate thymidylyltransferase / UDP-N-acetylgalactosamine diphosphorylase / glucosamine-1-phosphate N-acetyltransferase / galactosamine-1-phosphate N-acetyltransferase